ncbi:MAG: DUF5684 domain-containing protein [Flavobacteriales bacterium]|jgi:hypothetical protein
MDSSSSILAAGAGMLIFLLAIVVFLIVVMWKIYSKAGQPGWAVLVPIYNLYVYTQIIRRPGWWLLVYVGIMVLYYIGLGMMVSGSASGGILAMIGGLALFVVSIMDTHRLSTVFGQGVGFTIGLILLGIIFYPILAFGSSTYGGGNLASANAPIDQNM